MHSLIVGISESGKSHLAKCLARKSIQAGRPALVVNPLNESGWCGYITTRPERALVFAQQHLRGANIFLDEAGDYMTNLREHRPFQWFLRQARHRGHSTFIITQQAQLVIRPARNQVSRLYAFAQARDDAELLAREWNKPQLRALPNMNQYEFFEVSRFSEPKTRRL